MSPRPQPQREDDPRSRWFQLPTLFRPVTDVTPADEAAFVDYCGRLVVQLGGFGAAMMVGFTLLWWPLDPIVMPDAAHIEAFANLRVGALSVEVGSLLTIALLRPKGRFALALGPVFLSAFLFAIGAALGSLGERGVPWVASAWMGVVPAAFIPLRLVPRLVATTAVGAGLIAGFFLPHPENWAVSAAKGQVSYGVFAVLFAVGLGVVWRRVLRRAFFEQRALDRANGELEAMTDSLSELVQERTRELRALAGHLAEVQETERRQIARDLHDDLGQTLTAMRYTVARLEARLAEPGGEGDAGVLIEDLSALLDGTATTIRGVVASLRPRILDDLGLEAAAEWLCERVEAAGEVRCVLSVANESDFAWTDLDRDLALVAFRALQEGTTNALKHGDPARIEVSLALDGEGLRLVVLDDGCGFELAAPTGGFGLLGLRERAREAGGDLEVGSAPGEGTRLTLTLPLITGAE